MSRSPGVRHVTFAPSTRRVYVRPFRMTPGFRLVSPLARFAKTDASTALRQLGPELCLQLLPHVPFAVRRSCCSARGTRHLGPQRTLTSKSLPDGLSPPDCRCHPGHTCHFRRHRMPCPSH